MTRVLVTGFEPFGGSPVNPSQQLVERLAAEPPDGAQLVTALLPVSYARGADELRTAVRQVHPDAVVCFGQADGRTGVSLERFAINLDEPASVDNDGASSSAPIDPAGPAAYPSTLPVDELVAELREAGIPAAPSRDAGGFLCNHVFYALMRVLDQERPQAIGGFVHLPLLPEQALEKSAASLPLETLLRAGRVIVAACARHTSTS